MTRSTAKIYAVPEKNPHEDRRRHLRADIPLKARFMTEPGEEYPCIVSNISAGGALLKAKIPPEVGREIVLYIDDVGRFEGVVIRSGKHSFAVDYRGRRAKSKRTADALIQAMNTPSSRLDRRAAPRIKTESDAAVILENGEKAPCSIRDISLTGASIEIDPAPPLGAQLQLGKMMAKVVRRHEKGVGVVFTGSTSDMEEVFEQTTADAQAHGGAEIAKSAGGSAFGKKDRPH